jgi:predicted esterase
MENGYSMLLPILLLSSLLAPTAYFAPVTSISLADRKPEDIRIDGDNKKHYLLHAPPKEAAEPETGWRVLVVMPGGDGSAEFATFVGGIRDSSLGVGWVAAQIIAPKWDDAQFDQIVWPTAKNPYKGMQFSTEKLVNAVLDDLGKRRKIDPRYVFTLTWSSSGPAGYAVSLEPKTRITGSFVAMSVFKPETLPPLSTAAHRSYYLFSSKQDTTVPFWMAQKAFNELKKAGAIVQLAEYEGGHGWHGDVFAQIKKGVDWLVEKAPAPPPAPAPPKLKSTK